MSGAYLPTATHASASVAYFRTLDNDVFTSIVADNVSAATGDVLTLQGESATITIGGSSAINGLGVTWNTITSGNGNVEFITGSGSGVGDMVFYPGMSNTTAPTSANEKFRITSAGIVTPQLTLAGAVFYNPKPSFFNWSANNPGGSMLLNNGVLDVTLNKAVDSTHLYRVTFEVYMVQNTAASGLVQIYTDTSPIVYADVIPTSAITPALDFRRSYSMIVNPSASLFKILINNTSANAVNLTWQPILLEDLGVQPTAPTG
jgi:hypothetical protein